MITINDLNNFILIITLILMSYYILSSLGINVFDLFNMSDCELENSIIDESFINVNDNKNKYKKINKIIHNKEIKKNIPVEKFEEEQFIEGTNLLLFPLIKKVHNQNSVSNVNRNQSRDLRGDVYTNYSGNYTPFYSN